MIPASGFRISRRGGVTTPWLFRRSSWDCWRSTRSWSSCPQCSCNPGFISHACIHYFTFMSAFKNHCVFLLPCTAAVWQADLVRVSVVGELPASLCRHTEPHDPLHSVACEVKGENVQSNAFRMIVTNAKNCNNDNGNQWLRRKKKVKQNTIGI